jgi:hypothetical protein
MDRVEVGALEVVVIYSPRAREFDTVRVSLPAGACVRDALQRSGLLERHSQIDLERHKACGAGGGAWMNLCAIGTASKSTGPWPSTPKRLDAGASARLPAVRSDDLAGARPFFVSGLVIEHLALAAGVGANHAQPVVERFHVTSGP